MEGSPDQLDERFPPLTYEKMSPEQREVTDRIAASFRLDRGNAIKGPFVPWIYDAKLAGLMIDAAEAAMSSSAISPRVRELIFIMMGRATDCEFQWYGHVELGLKAGIDERVIREISLDRRPADMLEEETTVYDLLTELCHRNRVSNHTFARTMRLLGGFKGMVDLMSLIGMAQMSAVALNIAQLGWEGPTPVTLPISNPEG